MKHTKKAAAFLAFVLAFALLLAACGAPASGSGAAGGVYTQSAQGNNGPVTVEVEIADGAVTRVEVVENSETEGIADKPIAEIPAWIVENQSLAVDAVPGAISLAATYFVAVDTTYQQEDGMKISIDDYVAQTAETNPDIDSDRLRLLLENSQESLDWLNGLVEQIGGVLSNMDVVRLNPSVHSENGVNSSLSAARAEGGIIVNQQGLRFCNDYYPDYTTLSKWMVEQEGDYVYILIDQTAMDNSKRLQGFKDMGYFLEADTLEELAEKMNVPADNLVKTVEAYQEAVRTGVDEFGRTNNLSIDFSNPPYYAVTTSPGLQVSLGGILVDDSLRVQKQDGTSFDNLYAVGECADDGLFGCAPTNINITFGKMVADEILAK